MIQEIILGDEAIRYDLQRKKVKNINIRIKRDLSVNVSASPKVAQRDIERILREKSDFILSAIKKYRKIASEEEKMAKNPCAVLVFGVELPIIAESGKKNKALIEKEQITLTLKDTADKAAREKAIKTMLDALLREKVEEICREVYPSFKSFCQGFPTLKFRNMKSRWGSCNFKDQALTFNYSLIHAPVECIEFVIYHEFTHFIHPNHSSEFYKELSRFVPNHKELKKELECYKII
jgi:predicted metal-dependent hydrolase